MTVHKPAESFLAAHVAVIQVVVPPPLPDRHEPTADCNGRPVFGRGGVRCPECLTRLCACEVGYGHDCEV